MRCFNLNLIQLQVTPDATQGGHYIMFQSQPDPITSMVEPTTAPGRVRFQSQPDPITSDPAYAL